MRGNETVEFFEECSKSANSVATQDLHIRAGRVKMNQRG